MQLTTIGLDLAKQVFQVHGVDAAGNVLVRKRLRRSQMTAFFASLSPCLVGMEACATAHFWARELRALGHEVRLMPPQYVKPYVRRGKNDAADAAATSARQHADVCDPRAVQGSAAARDAADGRRRDPRARREPGGAPAPRRLRTRARGAARGASRRLRALGAPARRAPRAAPPRLPRARGAGAAAPTAGAR